jgi:hypothetical protein
MIGHIIPKEVPARMTHESAWNFLHTRRERKYINNPVAKDMRKRQTWPAINVTPNSLKNIANQ